MSEEDAYEQVAAEVARGDLKPGLWAKAIAESVGNESVAKSLYLKFRAHQLLSDSRVAEKHKAKQEFQASVIAVKHRTVSAVRRGLLLTLAIVCGLITLFFGLGMILGVLADSQNNQGVGGVGGAAICLVFGLIFGFATAIFAKARAKS